MPASRSGPIPSSTPASCTARRPSCAACCRRKGSRYSTVTHEIRELTAGQKLVSLVFTIDDGPKVRIRSLTFEGNTRVSSRKLRGVMKDNQTKPWWIPGFATSRGSYFETKFESDADRLVEHYRNHGYVTARVGAPRLEPIGDSSDGKTRWVDLRIPVEEGARYRVGEFVFDGAAVLKSEALRTLFKVKPGRYYAESAVRKGLDKARDIYGTIGYFEFTGYPDLKPRDPDGLVDVTMRLQEGKRYFVNVLSFSGNTVTRDNVIRRELALSEGGVFNTEALKYSVKRLNQLGYFKPIEAKDGIQVEKTPGVDNRVDVKVKVEEQNRNQLMFGGGFSQYDGVLRQLPVHRRQLPRAGRERVDGRAARHAVDDVSAGHQRTVSLQPADQRRGGSLLPQEQLLLVGEGGGLQRSARGRLGDRRAPLWKFLRGFFGFNYEVTDIAISEDFDALTSMATTDNGDGVPSFNAATDEGRHTDSRMTPSLVYNSVDHPFMPHRGMRLSFNSPVGGTWLGGSYNYVKPEAEAIVYVPTTRRTGFGFRAQGGWLHLYWQDHANCRTTTATTSAASTRSAASTCGPSARSTNTDRLLGGNKFVLFNAEYYLDLFGQVRLRRCSTTPARRSSKRSRSTFGS